MDIIQSKDNGLIKEIRKLKEKRFRQEKRQFLIEGFRFVNEALNSFHTVPLVFVSTEQKERFESFQIKNNLQQNTKVHWVSEAVLKALSSTETPQGIVAVVDQKQLAAFEEEGFYILVDKVQDPGNMGTIIRTAHAAGAAGVINLPGTVDIYNEKTLRSTMGSIFKVPIVEENARNVLHDLQSKGYKLVVSSLNTDKNYFDVDLKQKVIIAVGNEGNGISKEICDYADYVVKIPMPGNAESLNVAIAASVMMFEAVRQRLK